MLNQLLRHLGASVTEAPLRNDVFSTARQIRQAVAVIDTDGEAGRLALADIASREHPPAVLALATDFCDQKDRTLRQAGAQATLAKPIMDLDRLAATLTSLIRATRTEVKPPSPLVAPEIPALLDIAGNAHAPELLRQLLSDLGNAKHALAQAARRPDANGIRQQTHILIALAGTLGAHHLSRQCEDLNSAAHAAEQDRIAILAKAVDTGLSELLAKLRNVQEDHREAGNP